MNSEKGSHFWIYYSLFALMASLSLSVVFYFFVENHQSKKRARHLKAMEIVKNLPESTEKSALCFDVNGQLIEDKRWVSKHSPLCNKLEDLKGWSGLKVIRLSIRLFCLVLLGFAAIYFGGRSLAGKVLEGGSSKDDA